MAASSPAQPLDFDPITLPWTDRHDFEHRLQVQRDIGQLDETEAELLRGWHRDGYIVLPKKMYGDLIDQLLDDYERFWRERPPGLTMLVQGMGPTKFPEVPSREELPHRHYRVQDIQDESEAARRMILHPRIVRTLRLIFHQTPVAMQSLFFEYGSEQRIHQDFPYVSAQHVSHLVGCWMACEDVGDDNGPLFYVPGSHRLPKFDWGGRSLVFDNEDESKVDQFSDHLEAEAEKAGLERKVFHAQRGDVFLWHGALAHGGSPVNDPDATRRSLVVHYSTRSGYPRDRRTPYLDSVPFEMNGGMLYEPPNLTLLNRVKGRLRRAFTA